MNIDNSNPNCNYHNNIPTNRFEHIITAIKNKDNDQFKKQFSKLSPLEKKEFLTIRVENSSILIFTIGNGNLEIPKELAHAGAVVAKESTFPFIYTDFALYLNDEPLSKTFVENLEEYDDDTFFKYWDTPWKKDNIEKKFHFFLKMEFLDSIKQIFSICSENRRLSLLNQVDQNGNESIYSAILSNDKKLVEFILQQIPVPNLVQLFSKESIKKNPVGLYSLQRGCKNSFETILEFAKTFNLLESLLGQKDERNDTVIHHLCYSGEDKLLQLIIDSLGEPKFLEYLAIEGLGGLFPFHFAVQQKNKNTVSLLLKKFPEMLFLKNKEEPSILERIFVVKSVEMLEAIKESYTPEEAKTNFKKLLEIKDSEGLLPLRRLIDDSPIEETKQQKAIDILEWFRDYFKDDNYLLSVLENCNKSQQNLLTLAAGYCNLILSEYLIKHFPSLCAKSDKKGQNLYHYLSSIKTSEATLVNFFEKNISKLSNSLDTVNNKGETPLLMAKYLKLEKLSLAFIKAGADPDLYQRQNLANAVAHAWSLDHRTPFDRRESYPSLKKIHGWKHEFAFEFMNESLSYYLSKNKSDKELTSNLRLYNNCLQAFSIYSKSYEGGKYRISELYKQSKVWIAPLLGPQHAAMIVGYRDYIIICDRSPIQYLGSEEIIHKAGFNILRRETPLTPEEHAKLISIEGYRTDVTDYLFEKDWKRYFFLERGNQPGKTCCWTNTKGALFASLLIQMLPRDEEEDPESLSELEQKANCLYKPWSNVHRFYFLDKYKFTYNEEDPLVKAVESKACLKYIRKLVCSENVSLDLKEMYEKYISQSDFKELKYDFNKTKDRIQIISNFYHSKIPFLKRCIDEFVKKHSLLTISKKLLGNKKRKRKLEM